MSSLDSPSQSRDDFTAASPQSNKDESAIYDQINLGSRVKALLASLDYDSDEDANVTGTQLYHTISNGEDHRIGAGNARGRAEQSIEVGGGSPDDDDEDSDIIRPHGKLASRLLKNGGPDRATSASKNGPDETTNAYDRIRQQFLGEMSDVAEETDLLQHGGYADTEQELRLTRKFLTRKKRPVITETESRHSSRKSTPLHQSTHSHSPTSEAHNSASPLKTRTPSPDLFLTPKPGAASTAPRLRRSSHESDSDSPRDPQANNRFLALVAKKRAERQAKVAAEEQKRVEMQSKAKSQANLSGLLSDDDIEDDSGIEEKLTQQARPTRKASKRALEEMNRETQRMSRNMQLAHQAKTKKKVTKESLLAKFNFRRIQPTPISDRKPHNSPIATSSAPVSDNEGGRDHQTPPTSPLKQSDLSDTLDQTSFSGEKSHGAASTFRKSSSPTLFVEEDLPSMEDIMSTPRYIQEKGKGKAVDSVPPDQVQRLPKSKKTIFTQPPIRVRPLGKPSHQGSLTSDRDEDNLEIIPARGPRGKKANILDKLQPSKVREGRSLQTLRVLAHLVSPGKQNEKSKASMTSGELLSSLQRRARQQAARERAEKIQDLKDRGIIIQTTEERQRDQADVEDLLEKARREGEELTKKEKIALKKERRANGLEEETSDEDEDYKDMKVDVPDVELSGSDEEADDEDQASGSEVVSDRDEDESGMEEDEEENGGVSLDPRITPVLSLIDNEAFEGSEDEGIEEKADCVSEDDDAEEQVPAIRNKRRHNPISVLDDEDEEVDGSVGASTKPMVKKTGNPFPVILPGSDDSTMGLTQAFEATMAESQSQQCIDSHGTDLDQDSLSFLRGAPDPDFPMFYEDAPDTIVPDSQTGVLGALKIDLDFSQSQIQHDTPPVATQYSDIPDPTQDAGFGSSSPLPERFVSVPPSTVDTVVLAGAVEIQAPIVKKKGRLRRRGSAVRIFPDEDSVSEDEGTAQSNVQHEQFKVSADAFDVMKMASKKKDADAELFDKKKSDAKGMVEEQAEESEDEYAGLGGASDDDSMAEDDEEVRKMIDEGEVKVDERKLAAFFADKERASDAKAVEKLFKDINNGGLRRKRGTEFDLSDSDDDIEARRRIKRREFAKMRKALLENENVGKIAEDPKKLAFLRAIEDREDDEDVGFLEQAEESSQVVLESQENIDPQAKNSLSEPLNLKRKRPLQESVSDSANRPPPQARRVLKIKKPSTLAEIRESVSFLIEEPQGAADISRSDSSEEEEDGGEGGTENVQPPGREPFANRRRTAAPVIDRLSLKRAESAASSSTTTRLAFQDPNAVSASGFKVPSLLRRATTQVTDTHGITTAVTERAAGGGEKGDFVRRGGTKRSSINYHAREVERNKGVKEVERRKKEEMIKVGEMRRGALSGLRTGVFE
ncbi:hypothetical protein MMC11_001913 [Xylographa trunciseda]|nr:hypothetical protein [Xylographa trunciseda]